jgi:eukaryotic-like serine/threonine-protein kinase
MTSLHTPPVVPTHHPLHAIALAATHPAPSVGAPPSSGPLSSTRVTVLPRVENEGEAVRLVRDQRARYEPIRQLGMGGMGEVILVNDQDIARPVAIKRLLPELDDAATLVRFVDEIRTIGQLEHPNIVPIHDVGVDDEGRYFFVMKYIEGETLAAIIDKLREGDREYHRRYTTERRIEIFVGILHALDFAHAHGILHRDIKPANVMVGRYGEVVVMDWGIAKPMAAARELAARSAAERVTPASGERMFATRVGSYVGTPSYMSPEQALGQNDALDARSDLYSAAVLFHELVTLKHYLGDRGSLEALLEAVVGEDLGIRRLMTDRHPAQPAVPAELLHLVHRGLQKDPARRYQSAAQMIEVLQVILEGKAEVQCHVTLIKRASREMGRFVDRHPQLAALTWLAVAASVVASGVQIVRIMI